MDDAYSRYRSESSLDAEFMRNLLVVGTVLGLRARFGGISNVVCIFSENH